MKLTGYSQILDAAVAQKIAGSTNLAPRILAQLVAERKLTPVRPKMKFATTLLLALLAALLLTTAAYAVYRLLLADPGLQAVQDAGLVTNLNTTARPAQPTSQSATATPQGAVETGLSQTQAGVTLFLEWVYLDEGHLAYSLSYSPLPPGATWGAPLVSFAGVQPLQSQGVSQVEDGNARQVITLAYQVIQAAGGGEAGLSLDVPLLNNVGNPLASFHFDLPVVTVTGGRHLSLGQTYAVSHNGLELRLKSIRVLPSGSEVMLCAPLMDGAQAGALGLEASLQLDNEPQEAGTFEILELTRSDGEFCQRLRFSTTAGAALPRLVLRVHEVATLPGQALPPEQILAANAALAAEGIEIAPASLAESEGPGGWKFVRHPNAPAAPAPGAFARVLQNLGHSVSGLWEFHVELPSQGIIPGRPTTTPTDTTVPPLDQKVVEGVTITLDWGFVDALRAGVGYTIYGLPDVPEATVLKGRIGLKDAQGDWVGGAGIGSESLQHVPGQPGVLKGSWSVGFREPLTQPKAAFTLEIHLGSSGPEDYDFIAAFPIPPEATPYPPGVFPPDLPDRYIGVFQFHFTAPVYPLTTLASLQAVHANQVEMQVAQAQISPSTTRVMLCYAKPSALDWWVMQAILSNGSEEAALRGGSMIYDQDSGYRSKDASQWPVPDRFSQGEHNRCTRLDFLLGSGSGLQPLTLQVPYLEISEPEVLPETERLAAQEKLRSEGIEMEYNTAIFSGGGGGGGVTFSRLPEGMNTSQAYQRYREVLGHIYTGPWVFTLTP